jgi:hypothetical protein
MYTKMLALARIGYRTVPEANARRTRGFWTTRAIKLRGLATPVHNHSDYPTRIAMQTLVNSHVSARSFGPPAVTILRRSFLAETRYIQFSLPCLNGFSSSFVSSSSSDPFVKQIRYREERRIRIRRTTSTERTRYLVDIPCYLVRNKKERKGRLIGADAFRIP